MHPRIEPKNPRAFDMAIANPFAVVGNLTGVMTGVVFERPLRPPLIIYLWFPLNVGGRVELADLKLGSAVGAEATNSPVHDVTGDALNAINEIHVRLPVQRTVIHLTAANIGIVYSLLDERDVVRSIVESARSGIKHKRVGCFPSFGHVNPAWAKIVVPLAPGQEIIVVVRIHHHSQSQTP